MLLSASFRVSLDYLDCLRAYVVGLTVSFGLSLS